MKNANVTRLVATAAFVLGAASAHAGGPLGVCNSAPLKYAGAGTVTLNYDGGGSLGSRTKAQADAIVTAAASRWTDVSTATVTIGRGPDLPVDVTSANYSTYYGKYSDGLNPVIYDTDGSIVDALLGVGAKQSVLGFAGSAWQGAPTCQYIEGQGVINGAIAVSDATMTNVIAHELGHLIGLDHAQLDSTQGLATSNYPLMYPIAYRTLSTLHDDDAAAVSALYPASNVTSAYGTLSGNFKLVDGVTAVRGANIWASNAADPTHVFSVVSDYLQQNNGFFKLLLLPPGTYTLHAEAIASDFNGGSSVGPYSETYPTDPSFQAPMYVGGVAMAPVTLGNASPTQITIAAGCAATATFRIDGTGAIGGNCAAKTASSVVLSSSANPAAAGQAVTFIAAVSGAGGTPSGTVSFTSDGAALPGCGGVPMTGGTALCSAASLAAGSHAILAAYSGDGAYAASQASALTQAVNAAVVSLDLAIAQSAGASSTTVGKDVAFTLTASNNGTSAASGVVVTDTMPSGATLVWMSPVCMVLATTVTCPVGALAAGASAHFGVVLRPGSAGTMTNVVNVAATQPDPSTANNVSSASVTVGAAPAANAVVRYRLYSPVTQEHHFTTSLNEYNVLGMQAGTWVQEGAAGRVLDNPGSFNGVAAMPYYRLYNTDTRWHHWTTDANEYYTLIQFPQWNAEGVDGYILPSATAGAEQLYRLLYPDGRGLHHWTIDPVEYNALIATYGWTGEGGAGFVIQ